MKSQRSDNPVSLIIAESSKLGCELISESLRRAGPFSVLASTTQFQDTHQLILEKQPEVALISQMLDSDSVAGLKVIESLTLAGCSTRCIIMLETVDRGVVLNALRIGAKGIFHKTESIAHLAKCIHTVRDGQIWVGNKEVEMMVDALANSQPTPMLNAKGEKLLTDRESQIVALVAEGLTNRDIAERLNLSEHTIKNYLFRIFDKLGVSTRVELILYAVAQRPARNDAA